MRNIKKTTKGVVVGTTKSGAVVLCVPRRGDYQMTPDQAREMAAALEKHADEAAIRRLPEIAPEVYANVTRTDERGLTVTGPMKIYG